MLVFIIGLVIGVAVGFIYYMGRLEEAMGR